MAEEKQKSKENIILKIIRLYGWIVILFVFIVGVYSYFGVLRPGPPPPPRCVFGPDDTNCLEFQIVGDDGTGHGVVKFKLKNEFEQKTSFEFEVTNGFRSDLINSTCIISPNGGVDIEPEIMMEVICVFNQTFFEGDKHKFDIKANYKTPFEGAIYGPAQ